MVSAVIYQDSCVVKNSSVDSRWVGSTGASMSSMLSLVEAAVCVMINHHCKVKKLNVSLLCIPLVQCPQKQ